MVEPRRSEILRGTVVKPARKHPAYSRPQRCLWPGCRAILSHDHDQPVCSCHTQGYRLEHDPRGTDLVHHLLLAAYPDAIDLTAVLRSSPDTVKDRVRVLRRAGHDIIGLPRGYLYLRPQITCRTFARDDRGRFAPCAPEKPHRLRRVKVKAGGAHA